MKRLALLSLFSILVTSLAFSDGLFSFGVHGNFANLDVAEPLHRAYGTGFGFGLHGDYHLGVATVRVSGDYIGFGADHDFYTTLIYDAVVADYPDLLRQDVQVTGGGTISIISIGVNGKYGFPQTALSPYLLAGVGLGILSVSTINATLQDAPIAVDTGLPNQTRFMVNLGGGADFPVGSATLFVEARYTWIFTQNEKTAYIPVTLGVTF